MCALCPAPLVQQRVSGLRPCRARSCACLGYSIAQKQHAVFIRSPAGGHGVVPTLNCHGNTAVNVLI